MISRQLIFILVLAVLLFGTFVSLFTSWTTTSIHQQDIAITKRKKKITKQNPRNVEMAEPSTTAVTEDKVVDTDDHHCSNFMNNPSCKEKLFKSPKFDDFPEYRWPNQSALIRESPIVTAMNERRSFDSRSSSSYVSRQINNLQCFYDDDHDKKNEKEGDMNEITTTMTVRIYVPWKSFTYMTPHPFTCPSSSSTTTTKCLITNQKEDLHKKDFVDGYLVDSNGAYVNEVYDWVRNPLRFILVAFNTENIEGRRDALKKGYGLRYLAKPWNSTWWSFFHLTASYQRHSQVFISFFHWALCRDESFLRGYKHWEMRKWSALQKSVAKKDSNKNKNSNNKQIKELLLQLMSPSKQQEQQNGLFQPSILRGNWASKFVDIQNAPILFYVRNCDFTSHRRTGFMVRLSKYIPIDSVGNCKSNRHPKTIMACDGMAGNRRSCLIAEYRFYLCIENSISLDYVSEKVYEPLLVGTIPIYLGAPNVANFLPTKHSAILAQDFSSLKQLARYVDCISRNKTLYEYYTHWWKRPLLPSFQRIISKPYAPMCEVCDKIGEMKRKYSGDREKMIHHFDTESLEEKRRREPGVSGEFWDYEVNSQAPLKECLV